MSLKSDAEAKMRIWQYRPIVLLAKAEMRDKLQQLKPQG